LTPSATSQKKLLEEKRIEEPDAVEETYENGEVAEGGASGAAGRSGGAAGSVQGRRDALRRLAEIAAFFQRTEPHSPVAYLVQRAVKWGNMPLDGWLEDVIKDETVLGALRETLGLQTGSGDSWSSSGSSDDSWDSSSSDTSTESQDW
jgi:type VI secretion system protein ImpA